MKVAVVGSREFEDYDLLSQTLNELEITEIISGGARGADSLAEKYAKEKGISFKVFQPEWHVHGKSAGFVRNVFIIEAAETVVAFWDGKSKGTYHSIELARKRERKLILVQYKNFSHPLL
jgi:hypothetical protein